MPVQLHSNTDLVHGPAGAAPPIGKNAPDLRTLWERTWDFGGGVKQTCSKPLLMMGFNINPLSSSTEGPASALRNIDEIANKGLQRAVLRGVKSEPVAGRLHAELDQLLIQDKRVNNPKKDPIPVVGAVAVIPPLQPDPDVTRAIPLQAHVDATNWQEEMTKYRKELGCKLSAFSALMQMREKCGIKEKDNINLLKIVEKATKPGATETLWDLFTNHKDAEGRPVYDLTMSQKCKAGWFYWSCYQSSLINNTIESYMETFIEEMTDGLTSESNQMRFKLIRKLLENVNEFCVEDIGATKAFAFALEPNGDLEKYRRRTIEKHYGNSLEDLCKGFSKAVVTGDYKVPFFRRFQSIPVIGLFFQIFEWFVNRFIIQSAMKSSILPPALKSAVENGIEATEPHNLPFALEMTRFLNTQMETLRTNFDPTSNSTPPQLPGTEIISPTIKNLMLVLDLEQLKTQPELRRKFQDIETGKWFADRKIEDIIQEGIKDACHYLFNHLNTTAKSGELFANLLRLSCAPFSAQGKTHAVLMAEYKEEQLKLKRSAGDLFQKIIHSAVAKKVGGSKPEDAKKTAKDAFDDGQTVAKKAFDELKKLCEKMTEKIDHSAQAPIPENNVQPDIAAFLQIMQVYANRKEIQDRINNLQGVDRDAIWRLVTPLYERAAKLEKKILGLQELQDEYPAHVSVANQLKFINELLESVRNQFHAQPRHLRNPLIQTLDKTCEEIGRSLGAEAPATRQLKGDIKLISDLSESIAKEQQVIDALHAFYIPRVGQEVEQVGLLVQLLNYERGIHPRGFQPKACLKEIDRYLEFFPAEEQNELRVLIDNGSNMRAKWAQLSLLLQRIYEHHIEIKDRDAAKLDEALLTTGRWTKDKILKYTLLKDQDHTKMQKEIREISTDVIHLRSDAYRAQLDLPFYFTSGQTKFATAAVGAGIGWGLVGFGGFVGGPLGAAVGAGLGALAYTGFQNLSGLLGKKPGAIGWTAGLTAAGTAAAYLIPGAPAVIGIGGGALTGLNAVETVHANAQDKVLPEVMEKFDNACKLMLAPRIYLAFTTRVMQTLSAQPMPIPTAG